MRLNRRHRLVANARMVIMFGPPYGLARDLVTGVPFLAWENSPTVDLTQDGPGFVAGTSGGGTINTIRTTAALSDWAITGEITIAWRGYTGNTNSPGVALACMADGSNGGSNTPWYFSFNASNAGFSSGLGRANGSGFRVWGGQQRSGGSIRYTDFDAVVTRSLSQGADIGVAPTIYQFGVAEATPADNLSGGTGTGAASGGPFQVFAGKRGDGTGGGGWHTSNIAIVAARQWSDAEHLAFHLSPYDVLEDVPLWHFVGFATIIYSESIADSVSAADAITVGRNAPASLSDATTAGDAVSISRTAPASLSDAVTAGDTITAAAIMAGALADSVAAADSLATALLASTSLTDAAAVADAVLLLANALPTAWLADTAAGSRGLVLRAAGTAKARTPANRLSPGAGGTLRAPRDPA